MVDESLEFLLIYVKQVFFGHILKKRNIGWLVDCSCKDRGFSGFGIKGNGRFFLCLLLLDAHIIVYPFIYIYIK